MTGAHLLLVEDDDMLRELLLRNLQARGHDVRVAVDAYTALAQLQAVSFDLVLLDICLPDQTGWEVLRTAQKEMACSCTDAWERRTVARRRPFGGTG